MSYLLDRLYKLDKQIEENERALIHLNKQVGAKMHKIGKLRDERQQISEEYKESLKEEA